MDPQLVFILFAIALIAIITIPIMRKAKLGLLKPLEGEQTLFEEEDITTAFQSKNAHFLLTLTWARWSKSFQPKSIVRITNKRIIVAQKALFNKNKETAVIRQILVFKDNPTPAQVVDFFGGFVAKGGYMTFEIKKGEGIEVKEKKNKDVVVITIPGQKRNVFVGLGDMTMHFYTKQKEAFMSAIS